MKINSSELSKKFKLLKGFIPGKSIQGGVQGVLCSGNELIANNLEMSLTTKISTESPEKFIIPMSAMELIDNLPAVDIEIIPSANGISVTSSLGRSFFSTPDQEQFPLTFIPEQEKDSDDGFKYTILYKEEIEAISKSVIYSASESLNRPILGGIYFDGNGDGMSVVGCDSFRMASVTLPHPTDIKFLIPKKALQKIIALGTPDEGIKLYVSGSGKNAIFETADYKATARLISEKYIDWRKMLKKHNVETAVNLPALLDCLSRVSVCVDEFKNSKAKLEFDGTTLTVSGKSRVAEVVEDIAIPKAVAEPFKIGFNTRYLIDALKSIDQFSEPAVMYSTALMPVTIKAGNITCMISPVKIND